MKLNRFFLLILVLLLCVPSFFYGCAKSKPAEQKAAFRLSRGVETAPYQIEQFSDFYCPYCKKQAMILKKVMETFPGKFRWIFRHMPLSGQPGRGSYPVHEASMCADEQGKFWEFHDYVFSLNKNVDMNELVKTLALDSQKFNKCVQQNRYRSFVQADAAEAEKRNVSGTPTFFLNGEQVTGLRSMDYFAEKADPEFHKKMESQRKSAHEELMKRINPSETGRPLAGSVKAPITITEFSDFHCPFCRKLTNTLKQIMAAYPNDVRRVWRHFPLPIHPYSPYAHLAAECAHAQGKFWEFHAKLFSDPAERKVQNFDQIAQELNLNMPQFKSCFESPDTKKKIENDVLLGLSKEVGSTPTMFVNDEKIVGAKSFDELKAIVDRKLSELKKQAAA